MKNKLLIISLFLLGGCTNGLQIGTHIVVTEDEVPPYINMSTSELYTLVNHPIDFSYVTAYDDVDGIVKVYIDGTIDYSKPGEYHLTFISSDTSGNESHREITVIVHGGEEIVSESPSEQEEKVTVIEKCEKRNAINKEYPCNVVLSNSIEDFTELYYGVDGKSLCEDRLIKGETCEVIYTNDGSFWGYGKK